MQNALATIQLLVAPVVMISACGLLCLALYNRLAAIVSRARTFHKERFDALAQLERSAPGDAPVKTGGALVKTAPLRQRVDLLDAQVDQILWRGALVRNALMLLLATVLCMLGCSLALGLSILSRAFAGVALGLFVLGVVTAIAAIVCAIAELRRALDPVLLEATAIDELDAS